MSNIINRIKNNKDLIERFKDIPEKEWEAYLDSYIEDICDIGVAESLGITEEEYKKMKIKELIEKKDNVIYIKKEKK